MNIYVEHVEQCNYNTFVFIQPEEQHTEERPWEELGWEVGLDILDDEEVEQDEGDREVEQLLNKGKEAKQKLMKGTYSINVVKYVKQVKLNSVQYSTCILNLVKHIEQ